MMPTDTMRVINVLKAFAEILKANMRQSDICGRLGGEEFVMIITHVEPEGVTIAIERIRKKFETKKFSAWWSHIRGHRQLRNRWLSRSHLPNLRRPTDPRRCSSVLGKA